MSFNLESWKKTIKISIEKAGDWLSDSSPPLLYGYLCSMPLLPVALVAQSGDSLQALAALGSIGGGVGMSLIANQIHAWAGQDEPVTEDEIINWVNKAVRDNPSITEALDILLEKLDIITLAQENLGESSQGYFRDTLRNELTQLGNLGRFETVINVSGDFVQGDKNTTFNMQRQQVKTQKIIAGGSYEADQIVVIQGGGKVVINPNEQSQDVKTQDVKNDDKNVEQEETTPFVNRASELEDCLQLYDQRLYYVIDAPAGYGKTKLLKELKKRFENNNWYCIYLSIDNDDINSLRDKFIDQLNNPSILEQKEQKDEDTTLKLQLCGALETQYQAVSNQQKKGIILLIDLERKNFLSVVEFLIQDIFTEMYKRLKKYRTFEQISFRIILAGRYIKDCPEIRLPKEPKPPIVPLVPFNYNAIKSLVTEYQPNKNSETVNHITAHLLFLTGGHPGCVTEILKKHTKDCLPIDDFILHKEQEIKMAIKNIKNIFEKVKNVNKIHVGLKIIRFIDMPVLKRIIKKFSLTVNDAFILEKKLLETSIFDRLKHRPSVIQYINRKLFVVQYLTNNLDDYHKLCEKTQDIYQECLNLEYDENRTPYYLIEYIFLLLQKNSCKIETKNNRAILNKSFFNDVHFIIINLFVNTENIKDKNREYETLKHTMDKDDEFQFTVNYYLRKDVYNCNPYKKLCSHIENIIK